MFENSDDYDFAPSSSSKLSSLFDGALSSNNTNSSLKYTPPKQPKLKKDVDLEDSGKNKTNTQTSVVLAKVITLWKLEDKDYKLLGKHGLAIIGSVDLNLFEIISYKEKNNIILRSKLNESFTFYIQKDCFSSFYDNESQNWLVKFENAQDLDAFCKIVKSHGGNISDSSASPLKSPNPIKENVLKSEELPSKNVAKPDILPKFPPQTMEKDADGANSDSSGSNKKANILSRMAKMGQQILPNDILKNASPDISDSELDDTKNQKIPPRRFKRAVPFERHTQKEETLPQRVAPNHLESQMIHSQSNNSNSSVHFPHQNIVGPLTQSMVTSYQPNMLSPLLVNQPVQYDGFHQYIVSQNAELKINLAQISAKLDSVLSCGTNNDIKSDDRSLKSKIKTLELRSENLLTELERYEKKYDDLLRKCKNLEQQNIESQDDKSVIENLNKQIETLKQDLKSAETNNSICEKLEVELEKYKTDIEEHEKIIEVQKLKLTDFEQFYEENKDNKNLQDTIETLNGTISNLKLKLKDFEEYFLKTEEEKQRSIKDRENATSTFNDKIKDHMNSMYQSILTSFDENRAYSASEIKSEVAQNVKGTTFAIIKEFNDIYKNEKENISN